VLFCVYWSLTAEEGDGVGEKGPGETTFYVQAFLEAFSDIFLRSASFTDEGFSAKKQNFQSWHYFHHESDYWYF